MDILSMGFHIYHNSRLVNIELIDVLFKQDCKGFKFYISLGSRSFHAVF